MSIEETVSVICDKYCKYPYTEEQGNLDKICEKCPLNQLSNETQAEPTDAVSRDAVWGIIMRTYFADRFFYEEFTKKLDALPNVPVTSQKSGKWINDECGNVICSECKRFRKDCRYGHTNYCSHCGAKMFEPQESEDKE